MELTAAHDTIALLALDALPEAESIVAEAALTGAELGILDGVRAVAATLGAAACETPPPALRGSVLQAALRDRSAGTRPIVAEGGAQGPGENVGDPGHGSKRASIATQ